MSESSIEAAFFALLAGFDKAKAEFKLSDQALRQAVQKLSQSRSKFLTKVRNTILEKGMKDNAKQTAKTYGIAEYMIIDMLRKYLADEAGLQGNTIYPYNTFERFTQTCELPSKHWMHAASQTDFPTKKPKKSYSTLDKLEELRNPSNTIQNAALDKWKDKVKHSLFQTNHLQLYSNGGKDKFLNDIDGILVEFCKEHKPSDEDLVKKCKEICGLEEGMVIVTGEWLEGFKKQYQIE